jgi:hypothetical protein
MPYACQGCNTSFDITIPQNFSDERRGTNNGIDNNLVFIIDNTNVIADTKGYLEIYLGYSIQLVLSESDATIILFLLVMLVVIIVATFIAAIYLTCKIKNINLIISNHTKI